MIVGPVNDPWLTASDNHNSRESKVYSVNKKFSKRSVAFSINCDSPLAHHARFGQLIIHMLNQQNRIRFETKSFFVVFVEQ